MVNTRYVQRHILGKLIKKWGSLEFRFDWKFTDSFLPPVLLVHFSFHREIANWIQRFGFQVARYRP